MQMSGKFGGKTKLIFYIFFPPVQKTFPRHYEDGPQNLAILLYKSSSAPLVKILRECVPSSWVLLSLTSVDRKIKEIN